MGLTKRLLDAQARGGVREVPDPTDSISRYVCRKCFEGFLQREGRCCSCVKGRKRARNMALSMERDAVAAREKARLKEEVAASPVDFGYLFGSVPKAKDYGDFRLRAP